MSVTHEALELELSRCLCGTREVRVLKSPVDRPREQLQVSSDTLKSLQRLIDRYDQILLYHSRETNQERRNLAREIGMVLYSILTPGEVGRSVREALLMADESPPPSTATSSNAPSQATSYPLRLSFGSGKYFDPILANLPWELACDRQVGQRFLGIQPKTQIVRYLDIARRIRPLSVPPPLRILAILSSPREQAPIDLASQENELRRSVEATSNRLEIRFLRTPTLPRLRKTLVEAAEQGRPFHVLHYLGHGTFNGNDHGALYFEDEFGAEHLVRGQALADQLSDFHELRLVLLATCSGAKLPRRAGLNPFTGSASALIAANIPAVVAMQFNLSEEAARLFTQAFYPSLGANGSVEAAVAEGRLSISSADTEGHEWATPVLFLRSPGSSVLRVDEDAPEARPSGALPQEFPQTLVNVETDSISTPGRLAVTGHRKSSHESDGIAANSQVGVRASRIQVGQDVDITGIDHC